LSSAGGIVGVIDYAAVVGGLRWFGTALVLQEMRMNRML